MDPFSGKWLKGIDEFEDNESGPINSETKANDDEVYESIYEFLVVYMHAVSYIARVYPPPVYKLKRFGSCAVHECQHSRVRQWIESSARQSVQVIQESQCQCTLAVLVLTDCDNTFSAEHINRFGIKIERVRLPEAELDDTETQKLRVTRINREQMFRNCQNQYEKCLKQLYSACALERTARNRRMTVVYTGPRISPSEWYESDFTGVQRPITVVDSAVLEDETSHLSFNLFIS